MPPTSIENFSSSAIPSSSTSTRSDPRSGSCPTQRERRQDRGRAEPRQGCERVTAARAGGGPRDRGRVRRHLRAAGDGRGQGARRRGLRLLQPAHRAGGALRPGGRRRRAAGDRRGDRAGGRHREPRRQRALDVRRARRPADGRRRGGAAVRPVRARRPRRGDRAAVRRAVPPRGGVEGSRGRPGLRERPRGHRHRLRDHGRGAAARRSPCRAAAVHEDQPRQGPGLAGQAADRLAGQDRRARRCGGSRWASAGTRPSAAATSTSTRR